MSLFTIAWRSIQQRGLASVLTSISMALGVMLVVSVLTIHSVVSQSFRSNASLGYNMIVGAKGGKLQLTLNTVYYLSQPVENIPYAYYLEFLDAEARAQVQADPGEMDATRDGEFASSTSLAIPVCLGDYVGNFRSIGTTPDFFDKLTFGLEGTTKFAFAEGRNFESENDEHGFFEAVVGAVAAKELKIKLHDKIRPTHGDPETGHVHKDGFTVVGILERSGTPNDRAVFVNIEGFYLLEDHAKPVEDGDEYAHDEDAHGDADACTEPDCDDPDHQHAEDGHDHSDEVAHDANGEDEDCDHADHDHAEADLDAEDGHEHPEGDHDGEASHDEGDPDHAEHAEDETGHAGHDHAAHGPLPLAQREVTAVLVRTATPWVAPTMSNLINEGQEAQAVSPVKEIFSLFDVIVGPIQTVLLVLTAIICIVSGVSILVSIYNSMSERRHEIAVMRALGAGRGTVMTIILLESVLLSVVGGGAGWLLSHSLVALASPAIAAQTGVSIHFFDVASSEMLLIPALIVLAILCGLFPAISAYRTDVAKSLGA